VKPDLKQWASRDYFLSRLKDGDTGADDLDNIYTDGYRQGVLDARAEDEDLQAKYDDLVKWLLNLTDHGKLDLASSSEAVLQILTCSLNDRARSILAMRTEDIVQELAGGFHGSFAASLAEAWRVADSGNRRIIETNWSHLFQKVDPLFRP
jgi:hypothetical protein